MLRQLGFDPDDAENMMLTPELARARSDAAFEQQKAFVARVESQLPDGCELAAYAMLPWDMWNRRHGKLLAGTCGFYPTQPWNTMLLAGNQRTSFVLDIPEHPGGYPGGMIEKAEELLDDLAEKLEAVMIRTGQAIAAGRTDMSEFADTRDDIQRRVPMLANAMAELTLGEDTYWRHLNLFGRTLDWPFAETILARGRPDGPLWR